MIKIKFQPERGTVSVIVVLVATLVAIGTSNQMVQMIAAAVAAVIVVSILVAPGQLSITDRIARRFKFRRPVRLRNLFYSTSNVGTVWDSGSVAMYVAFLPSPFQVSLIDIADPILEPPSVPVDIIRNHLVQGDIHVSEISVLGFGYRRFASGPYNTVYHNLVGETPVPTTINTLIEVKVNLQKSYQSIKARATDGSIPSAAGRTAHIVAKRLEQQLNVEGYEARLERRPAVGRFHAAILASVGGGLRNEQWSYLGGDNPSVVLRPSEWTASAAERWYKVPVDRLATAVTITPGKYGTGAASIDTAICYTHRDAAKLPEKTLRLRRAVGVQGDTVTHMLPLAKSVPTRSDKLELAADDTFPLEMPGTGLGVYLGEGIDGGRCFVNLQTGGEVMYVHAPVDFIACLAARASAIGGTVGVHLDGHAWHDLARSVNPELIAVQPSQVCSMEIYLDTAPRAPRPNTAVVIWTPRGLPANAVYSISVSAAGRAKIKTPSGAAEFEWAPSPEERQFYPSTTAPAAV